MFQRLCPLHFWCVCVQLFFVSHVYSAEIPPSPAGGGWLELTQPGGYVYVEDHPDFDANLASEFTIQMWIYLKRYPRFGEAWPLMSKSGNYSLTFWGHALTLEGPKRFPEDRVVEIFYDFGGGTGKSLTSERIPLNTWHHLMCIKKKEASALYLNGQHLLDSSPSKDLNDTESPLYLSGSPVPINNFQDFPQKPFTGGLIDEMEVANTARHSPWNQEVPIPAGRLSPDEHTVALWHFDGPRKSAFVDSSLEGNHNLIPFDVNTGPFAVSAAGKLAVTWGHLKAR